MTLPTVPRIVLAQSVFEITVEALDWYVGPVEFFTV